MTELNFSGVDLYWGKETNIGSFGCFLELSQINKLGKLLDCITLVKEDRNILAIYMELLMDPYLLLMNNMVSTG